MNKQVVKFSIRRIIILAGLVGSLTFSAVAANHNEKDKKAPSVVQYVGATDSGIVFNVKYDNAEAAKFELIIKNEFGDVVYQQQFSDKSFDRKIVLVKEPGEAHLTFIIKSASETIKESFEISTSTRTVQEVVVKNVK